MRRSGHDDLLFASGDSCAISAVETPGVKDAKLGVERGIAGAISKLCLSTPLGLAGVF